MNNNKELEQIAKNIQKECIEIVDIILSSPDISKPINIQEATNVFLYRKLAEMELRLRELEKENSKTQSFIGRNTPLK